MSEINLDDLPAPNIHAHKRRRFSAIWIVPLIAIAAAGSLAVRTYLRSGPKIQVTFQSADGLQAGISDVRYKSVPVGKVIAIDISEDLDEIVATIQLNRGAAKLARKDTKFWVEKPRVGVGGVSGLSTLISGAYIGVDVGLEHDTADRFVGLEKPPGVTHDQHGTKFRISAADAGSLAARSPVYLRRQQVGQISELELAKDGKTVNIEIFVDEPYDKEVTEDAVFWNASGLDVSIDASGLHVATQSLATVVAGGIAFGRRDPNTPGKTAAENTRFKLYDDQRAAMATPDAESLILSMRFDRPVRGLGLGSAIDFDGIIIGSVDGIRLGFDPNKRAFFSDVNATVYPQRLGNAYKVLEEEGQKLGRTVPEMLQGLVTLGLRAQLRSGNLLTGSNFIALGIEKNAAPLPVTPNTGVWVVPTARGSTDQIQDQVASIVSKIDKIPFDQIGGDVHDATRAASSLLSALGRDVVPDTKRMIDEAEVAMRALREGLAAIRDNVAAADAPIQQSARATLQELENAARSLRGLGDYLKNHPESLLRGRATGSEPK